MFNAAFNLKIYGLKIIVIFPVLVNPLCTEQKDKEPRTAPDDLQSCGWCFRRDKNEKSQRANDGANNGDNL